MDKNYKLFLILGIVVLIVPFLGIPELARAILVFIVGVILIVVSLMHRAQKHFDNDSNGNSYVDSDNSRSGNQDDSTPEKAEQNGENEK